MPRKVNYGLDYNDHGDHYDYDDYDEYEYDVEIQGEYGMHILLVYISLHVGFLDLGFLYTLIWLTLLYSFARM